MTRKPKHLTDIPHPVASRIRSISQNPDYFAEADNNPNHSPSAISDTSMRSKAVAIWDRQGRRSSSETQASKAAIIPPSSISADGKPSDSSWEDFCQKTSLSGFKFLSTETSSKWRRVCWAVVMVVLVSLTAYQNFKIIKNYVETPYIINVEKIFVPQLKFPKILICNAMPWRVSAVRPPGVMHAIFAAMFRDSQLHAEAAEAARKEMANITDSRAYLESIAFRKEDMIIWCQWRGQRCTADNFTTELLPDRVCFSFNGGEKVLFTDDTGTEQGLQLVLDIGQYEQMNGPYETYGIQQAFIHRNDVPSIAKAVSVPAGYYTFVSLLKRDIQYLPGENCGEIPLTFFSRYSREACIREQLYTSVRQRCHCWPFSIEPQHVTNGTRICTLTEHFTCAMPLLQRAQQENMTRSCPLECYIKTYVPSTSFAAVAWDQIRKRFQLKVGNFLNRTREAFESAKRFRPSANKTTRAVLQKVTNATVQLKDIIGRLNRLSIDQLQTMPPTKSLHPFDKHGTKFASDVLKPGIATMNTAFQSIARMASDARQVFENQTLVKYLLDEYVDISKSESRQLSSAIFSVSRPRVGRAPLLPDGRMPYKITLNLLLTLSKALTDIRLAQSSITTGIDDFMYSSSDETIMRREPAELFSGKVNKLFKSLYGFSHGKGCMEGSRRAGLKPSLSDPADLFGCLVLIFSSESIRTQAADNYRYVVNEIPDDSPDADHQYSDCKQLLCMAYMDKEYCEFDVETMHNASVAIVQAMQQNVNYCNPIFTAAAADLTNFTESYYLGEVIPYFTSKRQITENFRKNNERIRDLMKTRPWVSYRTIDAIQRNITAYQTAGMPYRILATRSTRIYRNWLDTQFEHNFAQLSTTLTELVVMFRSMKANAELLLNFANPIDSDELDGHYSISAVIMNNLLWGRSSKTNLQMAVNVSSEFLASAMPILSDIPDMTAMYVGAVQDLISDSEDFNRQLVVNDAEFFKRNFLIMNVHYAELSREIISQNRNLEFWKLLADLGGSNGLWLSFSMVAVFEIIDYCLRAICGRAKRLRTRYALRGGEGGESEDATTYSNRSNGTVREMSALDRM